MILHIRSDIDKEKKTQTIEACKELLSEYDIAHSIDDDERSQFVSELGGEDEEFIIDDGNQEEEKKMEKGQKKSGL